MRTLGRRERDRVPGRAGKGVGANLLGSGVGGDEVVFAASGLGVEVVLVVGGLGVGVGALPGRSSEPPTDSMRSMEGAGEGGRERKERRRERINKRKTLLKTWRKKALSGKQFNLERKA